MAVTERTRHELHEALVELMGPEKAETLMESLPPVGWGDIATKHDLGALEDRIELRLESLEHRILSAMDRRLRQTGVTMAAMMISQSAVLVTLILALR